MLRLSAVPVSFFGDFLFPGTNVPVAVVVITFLVAALAVALCSVLYVIARKLRASNRLLEEKTKLSESLNKELADLNNRLSGYTDSLRSQLSDSESFFRVMIESAGDRIAYYDTAFNLKFANRTFYSILGLTPDEYEKIPPGELLHPDDKNFRSERLKAMSGSDLYECEIRLRHRDGHYIILSSKTVSVRNAGGERTGFLVISRDISALKRNQEEIIRAKADAESGIKLRASFLANISHEIRTPLNSVVGFANLLYDESLTSEARADYIDHINYNSEKLLQVIGDIIDLSRLDSSELEITYTENYLSEIIREVMENTNAVISRNEKPVVLTLVNELEGSNDLIFTDRLWLKRVFNHLLENAVKFTLEGSVEIKCRKQGNDLLFSIKDTGIGINSENLKHIFEGFRQEVNGSQRPFEGLGVGLTLVREVIRRMGGSITVESEKGMGSVFTFSIPYRPAGSTSHRPADLSPGRIQYDWSSKKCLIVDDNMEIIFYLKRILSDTGIEILTAVSGPEALSILTAGTEPDLILLDMQMPGMNGIETTRAIRERWKNIPVIVQTAFIPENENDKDVLIEAGCDACLIKPVRKDNLLSTMSLFLK